MQHFTLWGSCVIAFVAMTDVFYTLIVPIVEVVPILEGRFLAGVLGALTAVFVLSVVEHVIRQRVGTQDLDGDGREYLCAAWVCVSLGTFFVLVEGGLQLIAATSNWSFMPAFLFEDLLLGIGALAAISEEVRLNRKTTRM